MSFAAEPALGATATARRPPPGRGVLGRLARDPMGLAGLVVVCIFVGVALFAPWLAP